MNRKLSENIRRLRREKKITQEKLAETLGVTVSAVSKWETGASSPDLDLLPAIAECFDTSIDLLMSYEYHKKSVQKYVLQIKQLGEKKRFDECTETVEQAIRRFSNNFEINYLGAQAYFLMGVELHDNAAISRSINLYNRSLELSSQSDDAPGINWNIQNEIAQAYLCLGDINTALSILQSNNAGGCNDPAIGYALCCNARRGEEARPYLSRALAMTLMQMDRIFVAYTNVFEQAGDYSEILNVMDKMISVYDIFRIPGKVSYLDKLEAKIYSSKAMIHKFLGNDEEMTRNLQLAYQFAELYDNDPQNNLRNIRFCEDCSDSITPFDDFGATVSSGIEDTMNKRRPETAPTRLFFWETVTPSFLK